MLREELCHLHHVEPARVTETYTLNNIFGDEKQLTIYVLNGAFHNLVPLIVLGGFVDRLHAEINLMSAASNWNETWMCNL